MNIEKCLGLYCDIFFHEFWGINQQIKDEESLRLQAIDFLKQYSLNDLEYKDNCVPVMKKVFRCSPEMSFDVSMMSMSELIEEGFEYFSYYSSPLFWKESYELIQKISRECGDNNIYIIEDESCEKESDVAFKIKIPVSKSWEDLSNGGFIADVLFNMPNHNYYVFGDSGKWGKWCDYDNRYYDYETFCCKHVTPSVLDYKSYFSEYIIEGHESRGTNQVVEQV